MGLTTLRIPAMTKKGSTGRHYRLLAIFATLYFVQGIAVPMQGIMVQPIRSLLKEWGLGASEMASFMFIMTLPWMVKPIYGLLTDFLPIKGCRRRYYFLITGILTTASMFIIAAVMPLPPGSTTILLTLLLISNVALALNDVVTDGHMVDTGQPLGITGRLQSVQWIGLNFGLLLAGVIGGYISEHNLQRSGFLACGLLALLIVYIALFQVREKPEHNIQSGQIKVAGRALWRALRTRNVLVVAAFLFFINFNPFSLDVRYLYMTQSLELSEKFVGYTYSGDGLGAIVACILYGVYSPRIPTKYIVHISIASMVLTSLGYIVMIGPKTAIVMTTAMGFSWMLALLCQFDLAARFCPSDSAGTVFAMLMSLLNLGQFGSSVFGGTLYDHLTPLWGETATYNFLVVVGCLFTAACWILIYFFPLARDSVNENNAASDD